MLRIWCLLKVQSLTTALVVLCGLQQEVVESWLAVNVSKIKKNSYVAVIHLTPALQRFVRCIFVCSRWITYVPSHVLARRVGSKLCKRLHKTDCPHGRGEENCNKKRHKGFLKRFYNICMLISPPKQWCVLGGNFLRFCKPCRTPHRNRSSKRLSPLRSLTTF